MGQEKMVNSIAAKASEVIIGIDISKAHLDAFLHPDGVATQFSNDKSGRAKLIAWARIIGPARIIFEATGAYHRGLEMALSKASLPAVKINPLQARRFAQATGRRVKTDELDAAMLARFAVSLMPDITPARDQTIDTLTELLVARRALVKDRTAALNRAKTLTLALLTRQSQQHLKQIDAQIKAIDLEQRAIVATDTRLQARLEILVSIPGLGVVTALALLIGMPELGSRDAKHAASLAGLAPVTRQSGQWRGKSFIQGGRATIRQAIYMPALVAIRFNPDLKAKYLTLRAAGKPAKMAIVAIMRKLIITANALLRDNRVWTARSQAAA
jgi:transposase